jgi:hypothetical protein
LCALLEQVGVWGVQVLRPRLVGLAGRVTPCNEAAQFVAMPDWEDESIAEPVDQPPGSRVSGEPGGNKFVVGGTEAMQVSYEVVPSGWGVAGREPVFRQSRKIGSEPVG